MPIDTSIYQNLQQPQIQAPNPLQSAAQAMQLGSMGMQQMQMARQLRTQSDVQDAYMRNTDPQTGQLDQAGVLTTLGRTNPFAQQQVSDAFAARNEAQAKAKSAQIDAAQKAVDITGPTYEYMDKHVPEDQRATVWPQLVQQMKDQGVDTSRMDPTYDPQTFQQHLGVWRSSKAGVENMLAQASIPAKQAEIQSTLYGSRSPNSEISSQYSNDVKPIRASQLAMAQGLDSYKNKTPQGDASLVLQNFKIRNPQAVDVNSLEEMKSSQSVGDKWKNKLTEALAGGFDDNTRDNLMRDMASAYRANVQSLGGIQKKYYNKAVDQGTPGASDIVSEPAIDRTNQEVSVLSKKLGPYVPPAERGGVSGAVANVLSKITGTGKPSAGGSSDVFPSANASTKGPATPPAPLPAGMLRIQGPDGKIYRVPKEKKGWAISNGGSVVK